MIKEISIKNFKSIEEATIKPKNINIFIGANNSGKSNLLEALEMYHNGNETERDIETDTLEPTNPLQLL